MAKMTQQYDLITVGGGSGGLGAAGIARTFGLKTLLIEAASKNIGGDCLNYGCVPSKALIHISKLIYAGKTSQAYGIESGGEVNFEEVLKYVHRAQDRIREHENAEWLAAQQHQDVVIGWARFVDHNTLEVEGNRYSARKIVLATGSRPRELNVPGIENVQALFTNHNFFSTLRPLPKRLLVIGGGPIACELGQAMHRLGSSVTLINLEERICAKELSTFSELLQNQFRAEGIRVINQAEVSRFRDHATAIAKQKGAEEFELSFDEVLVAIGRDASLKDMNVEAAGIDLTRKGIVQADDYYRTTNPSVFVVGDAYGREMFSHGAEMHNRDLIFNMLSPIKKKHSLSDFSWVTFTDPEIATFGLSKETLEKQGKAFETVEQPFSDDDRAIAGDYADKAHLTLYVRKSLFGGAKLLGGSMIAPGAGELIQELVLAKQEGISLNAIFNKIYAYPVATRINQKAAFSYRQGGLGAGLKGLIRTWWRI